MDILKRFGMDDCSTVTTPATPSTDNNSTSFESCSKYQELVGNLIYLSVVTRPDIACCIHG
jgi:hypothetical protein